MLVDVHPSIDLSSLLREVKQSSSKWLNGNANFPSFDGWAKGYFAESVGRDGVESCRQYILKQQEHHSKSNFLDEIAYLNSVNGLEFIQDDWG